VISKARGNVDDVSVLCADDRMTVVSTDPTYQPPSTDGCHDSPELNQAPHRGVADAVVPGFEVTSRTIFEARVAIHRHDKVIPAG
jgi:hypothetical protein